MRIWYPLEKSSGEDVSSYIAKCRLSISILNICINNCINRPSLKRIETIIKGKNLLDFIRNKESFSIFAVINQFENTLHCYYDTATNRCFFDTPRLIKAINTRNSLDYVIRLIEFGNQDIPPTNLIRHSYMKYFNLIVNGDSIV
jgi:hypothetical protein